MNSADLDRYFERIGYGGDASVSASTLHALTQAQSQSIAFENMDVLLGEPISLQPRSIFQKLVEHQRGGYCFEQNLLLWQVLRRLGFDVQTLGARVRLDLQDRDVMPARTHLLLSVQLNDELWVTDCGFGGYSLTQALEVQPKTIQDTPHGARRLDRIGSRWFQQVLDKGQWRDIYEFEFQTMPVRDLVVANWYTSTHPDSQFVSNLTVALARARGVRISLYNRHFKTISGDGSETTRILEAQQVVNVLQADFGLEVPQAARLCQLVEQFDI